MENKVLMISDTHRDDETFQNILDRHRDADLIIHAGDTSMKMDDEMLKGMLVVQGNHDLEPFPEYIVHPPYFICHGHTFHVYENFDTMLMMAKKNHCSIIVHGHTHIAYDQVIDGIRIINPGSALINRGSYGYGTYAVYYPRTEKLIFYHHKTHEDVTATVVPDGVTTLQEFRELLASFIKRTSSS